MEEPGTNSHLKRQETMKVNSVSAQCICTFGFQCDFMVLWDLTQNDFPLSPLDFSHMTVQWLSDSYFCFSLFSLSSNSVSVCIVGHSLFLILHSVQLPKLSPFRHKLLPTPSTSTCTDTLTEAGNRVSAMLLTFNIFLLYQHFSCLFNLKLLTDSHCAISRYNFHAHVCMHTTCVCIKLWLYLLKNQ